MTVRNEERYIRRTLEHLESQGVEVCLIDNGSTDRTVAIAEEFLNRNVMRIEHFPFHGQFALKDILENEERLASEIEADWFIHHDADEIREAPAPWKTLQEGFAAVEAAGFNAVNFDEFVFLPTEEEPNHSDGDFVATMQYYYFLEPSPRRRINAWARQDKAISLAASGGHQVRFKGRNLFPENFIMRHYIVQSLGHAIGKYCGRVFAKAEHGGSWHGARISVLPEDIKLPSQARLHRLNAGSWNKSNPWKRHEFMEPRPRKKPLLHRIFPGLARKKKQQAAEEAQGPTTMFDARGAAPPPNGAPMPFVVGVGRSGSTMLRLMLDAHPELAIPWETHFFRSLFAMGRKKADHPRQFLNMLTGHPSWPDFHLDEEELRRRVNAVKPFSARDGLRIFYALYAERFGKNRWGDKTPTHDVLMVEIAALLPEARFIHLIRDGRDVALSHRGKWFGPGDNMHAQAAEWVTRIKTNRNLAQHVEHFMEVRYEELVQNPEAELRRICAFIELPFEPSMLEYHKKSAERLDELVTREQRPGGRVLTKEKRVGIFELTNKPPQTSRIGRWRTEMTDDERREYEDVAGDMLRDLGY